jgi:quercetin dioxygenase-like cupin family protein
MTEIKHNSSTPLRPEGDRLLDADMVLMDLDSFRKQIKLEKAFLDGERNAITLFKSDQLRLILIALHEGAEMKTHTAPGTISVQVLEGFIEFTTPQRTVELAAGQMLALHKEIPHSVLAKEETTFLLTLTLSEAERAKLPDNADDAPKW